MSRITADNPVPWKRRVNKRMGLIDADGILYAAALEGQTMCDGAPLQVLDEEAVYRRCVERIEAQMDLLGDCPTVFICLSARKNFRKDILPSYKANRSPGDRPILLDWLRGKVIAEGIPGAEAMLIENLEADDVCGILSTSFQNQGYDTCIVSPDKDMATIPGMWVTPKGIFSELPEERADFYHMLQTLMGDTTDNYKGCPGIGIKKGVMYLEAATEQGVPLWEIVLDCFQNVGLTEEDALTQARVARILRAEDWDSEKKEVILWEPK